MEKKKLKLSISGSSKKTISSIEQAKSQSRNSVVIEKKSGKFSRKQPFQRSGKPFERFKGSGQPFAPRQTTFNTQNQIKSDFEKRKIAEQRATRRLKGDEVQKDGKGKIPQKKRELKLTLSRALSEEDIGSRSRSLASYRRAKLKENRELSNYY